MNKVVAKATGLFHTNLNNSVYIGVDFKNKASGRGRNSIRIESINAYNLGLFVLDLAHMPGSICVR